MEALVLNPCLPPWIGILTLCRLGFCCFWHVLIHGSAAHISQRNSTSFPGNHLAAWLWGSAELDCLPQYNSFEDLQLVRKMFTAEPVSVFQRFLLWAWQFSALRKKCSLWISLIFKGSVHFNSLNLWNHKMAAISLRGHKGEFGFCILFLDEIFQWQEV